MSLEAILYQPEAMIWLTAYWILLGYCHLWQYPTTKLSGSTTSATISGMISGPIVPFMCWRMVLRNANKKACLVESK
jgi:hypothetical protein